MGCASPATSTWSVATFHTPALFFATKCRVPFPLGPLSGIDRSTSPEAPDVFKFPEASQRALSGRPIFSITCGLARAFAKA